MTASISEGLTANTPIATQLKISHSAPCIRKGSRAISVQPFQLRNHAFDHAKAALPEGGVAGIQPERSQELGVMLGAARREHRQIAFGEPIRRALVDRVQRIDQAIAERICVDIERRVHEVRNVGPEGLVTGLELDRRAEALMLHFEPERVEAVGGQLSVPALQMDTALE